ncbi:UDP-N-acetylmuramoyl-tripeptide--D-alanyl-D-alanine ligase [Mesonia aestuariivivens]|uniref:UDP-N-acetylmuramoyl-tripeptide--D-alanyl-D-alanine ligase n=1 Tax=Mesonia aestuariivivens TaxID=2796128 RepID=A0ABS6W6E9_9FLAO|nr:UDP-N-acetylmuramoyl-tripeptide--D-alanyl-D-alanine ligase [Mesonia aestuariivivens]MBW2962714.1 UDP-N-acetylmuramoyl-tripeptide--D-alanyl-D-alanine ligase [Mesonia aestuariivivens]
MKELNHIHQLFLESTGICTDTRKLEKRNIYIALKGENFNGNNFALKALKNGASHVIVDDDITPTPEESRIIKVKNTLSTLQNLAAYHRKYLNIPIISITGSNGKTTTKELINVVLTEKYKTVCTQGNLNNHIGVPLTLLAMNKQTELGVVEMGANHQGEIKKLCEIAQPDYGYITNFGKAHLEGFGGFEGVIKGKSELYQYLIKHQKTIFINADDEIQVEKSKGCEIVSFSEGKHASQQITFLKADPFVKISTEDNEINSQLIGTYNAKNIAAAICIGKHFHVSSEAIKNAIEEYTPNNNRSQIITKNTNNIILDAYNANPTSMKAALENLEKLEAEQKMVILGDMFEVGDTSAQEHQEVINELEKLNFKNMYVCGKAFYHCNTKKTRKFEDFNALKTQLETENFENTTILIKGSRGMALERIVGIL